MRRTKLFLILVIILLVVNATFFLSWYGLGLRDRFREFVSSELGKVLKGKVSIAELHFSDRQLFAEGIVYAASDSTVSVKIARFRAQYNLLRFAFGGFKVKRLVTEADIYQPVVSYNYHYKPKVPKPKKPLILPDLAGYFNSLRVIDGAVSAEVKIPVKIIQAGELNIRQELHKINLTAITRDATNIKLNAQSGIQGALKAEGILKKGRIVSVDAEITRLNPQSVSHPDLQNVSSEISLVTWLSQDSLGAALKYEAKAQLWSTKALFAQDYPVSIPYLWVETDGHNLGAQLSRSTMGNGYASAEVDISELGPRMKFNKALAEVGIDLKMIDPRLSGFVRCSLNARGTLKDPQGSLTLNSDLLSYQKYSLADLAASGEFKDGALQFEIPGIRYINQSVNLKGSFSPALLALDTHLETHPLRQGNIPYLLNAELDIHAELPTKYPMVDAKVHRLELSTGKMNLKGIEGGIKLLPGTTENSYYVDASLSGGEGFKINLIGDILDRNLLLDAEFKSLYPAAVYALPQLKKFDPELSGKVEAILQADKLVTHTQLDVTLHDFLPYSSRLDLVGNFDLNSQEGAIHLQSTQGRLNDQDLDFSLAASLKDRQLQISGLHINDLLSLSGRIDLLNPKDLDFSLAAWNLSYQDIIRFYPAWDINLPEFNGLTLFADYNQNQSKLFNASLSLNNVDLLAITPVGMDLQISGPLTGMAVSGVIDNVREKILELSGTARVSPQSDLQLTAKFKDLSIEQIVLNSPLAGVISGSAGFSLKDLLHKKPQLEVAADLKAHDLQTEKLKIDRLIVKAKQNATLLQVDSLYAYSSQLLELAGSGAIDYNAITREFFEGNNRLNLKAEGQLFAWLKDVTPYILESHGNSSLTCSIGVLEDQFLISGGALDISDGFLRLKDQSEPLTNINIKGTFDKNRIIIERGQVQMGEGKLLFNNIFEADNSDHFMLGFMDLGILRALIEEPGILASIPLFTPPKTLTNIVLKGKNSRYAMIKGPFDQMKISAEVILSNASALFPPNTDNLLKLANSVREATIKHNDNYAAPLPFTLDVLITLGDNVRYTTYPAKLNIQPGGYLLLLYDGLNFTVQEAYFSSERGTVDIFGTVFQVDKVDITMVDSQDVLNVDGVFYKRAPDGTMITLKAVTLADPSKSFMDRLKFSLTSDNPDDRTISQILSRLRYTGSNETSKETQNGALQDEALTLISGNLDASLYSPFLSPVETYVRRKLRLDNFSISAGFLQNLYTQYSNDPSQLANYTDMKQLTTDIAQFSSSILLNNLSVSASKYLGRRMFWDYQLELQEATDLQKRTRIMVSHETSLRFMLPKKYRLGYTLKYTPQENKLSHEIMLQRSFRFWGL